MAMNLFRRFPTRFPFQKDRFIPLLRRLTKEGYFTTYLQESTEGPPRKYYKLTDTGREYLHEQLDEWRNFTDGVNTLIEESVQND